MTGKIGTRMADLKGTRITRGATGPTQNQAQAERHRQRAGGTCEGRLRVVVWFPVVSLGGAIGKWGGGEEPKTGRDQLLVCHAHHLSSAPLGP
jgi:hypothetical protein